MDSHSFDPKVAVLVGLNAAVLYKNILYWCEKNKANNRHLHDGYYWTYNSMKAYSELFPYLTIDQIRTALKKLTDIGLIQEGSFNKAGYDRTKWYNALKINNWEKSQMDVAEIPNGIGKNPKPIPDINTDIKHNKIIIKDFEVWWKLYPRKIGKQAAKRKYEKYVKEKTITEKLLIDALKRQLPELKQKEEQYIPHPATWLNQGRWDDEVKKKKLSGVI